MYVSCASNFHLIGWLHTKLSTRLGMASRDPAVTAGKKMQSALFCEMSLHIDGSISVQFSRSQLVDLVISPFLIFFSLPMISISSHNYYYYYYIIDITKSNIRQGTLALVKKYLLNHLHVKTINTLYTQWAWHILACHPQQHQVKIMECNFVVYINGILTSFTFK